MRYTARQQHCLQAMGMVPWVSRLPEDAAALLAAASKPATAETQEASTTGSVASIGSVGSAASIDTAGSAAQAASTDPVVSAAQTAEKPVEKPAASSPPESTAPVQTMTTADPLPAEVQPGRNLEPESSDSHDAAAASASPETPVGAAAERAASAAMAGAHTSPPSAATAGADTSPPAAIENLGHWLLQQELAPIEFRGGLHPVLGVADAPVLVVLAQDASSPAAGSMSGDDGRLFELMLRSIALSNRDTRRCQLASQSALAASGGGGGADVLSQAGVGGLCSKATRGVLVLMNPWSFDRSDTAVEQHQSRLPESGLPLWRIAHPAILLDQPQLKRQAWQVLKRLRATLDGTAL